MSDEETTQPVADTQTPSNEEVVENSSEESLDSTTSPSSGQASSQPSPEASAGTAPQAIEPSNEGATAHPGLDEPLVSEPEDRGSKPIEAEISMARPPVSDLMSALKIQAEDAVQNRKRIKLDKIMTLFDLSTGSGQVTNDDVEKLLHVSDATATRYLSILKKEGRIVQSGKTGQSVSYSKI